MEPIKVVLTWARETKNTHRYEDNTPDSPVPLLYVPKRATGPQAPPTILVTVEAGD